MNRTLQPLGPVDLLAHSRANFNRRMLGPIGILGLAARSDNRGEYRLSRLRTNKGVELATRTLASWLTGDFGCIALAEFGRSLRSSFPDFRSHFGRSLRRTGQLAEVPRTEAAWRIR